MFGIIAIGIGAALDHERFAAGSPQLPNAPLAPWMMFLNFLSAYPLKNAARSSGRSVARMPTAAGC